MYIVLCEGITYEIQRQSLPRSDNLVGVSLTKTLQHVTR